VAAVAPDFSHPMADSTGEMDKWRRRVMGKVAAWFALAGIVW
jgi:hypothetical protein